MAFRVGQKVACIHHVPLDQRRFDCVYAEKGGVYTVRDIYLNQGRDLLLLQEIRNPAGPTGDEYGFNARGFRPVVKRKTSIEIFTAMLKPQQVDA
jgi:hypothetical protein